MKNIKSYSDWDIVLEEYKRFMSTVKSYSKETPYYCYAICEPNGTPFYIGKGKLVRGISHVLSGKRHDNEKIAKRICALGDEAPIAHIISGNLSSDEAYKIEEQYISIFGRECDGGILVNVMPGGSGFDQTESSRVGGKIGGRKTKDSSSGIFSPDYDRGAQTKLNWELGLIPKITHEHAVKMGTSTRDRGVGIFAPENQQYRSEWGRNAALRNIEVNGVIGCCTVEYREANKESLAESSSNGGKKGGVTTGKKLWWNDGKTNQRFSVGITPEGLVRGMLMSDKKKSSLFGRKVVTDDPSKTSETIKETI